ncbi:trafficking protein particle complex subunit 9-like isoform X2 [Dendronephthya gigantea]|uniref:trafficking protein particle complex subunit 9-like isoform X2 n=1 Tax=Dendronephthya gigantea TaxID=151771 RepID=UPI00106D5FB7|nr:trafficking protein particle complex subunit 9-like isoform X2 [Dendronephthya gigantea]
MLRIDFNQRFLDHRSILVFVKKLGAITEADFSELFNDISQLRTLELPNGRTVHLRYTRHISHQFIEWGSFHMHRKLLGILSVAKTLDEDIYPIKTAHESLKTWYGNTALHCRCFILGGKNTDETKDRELVFLNQDNVMKEIEKQMADYALSLFLVLESKKKDKSLEKPEKFAFLRSPLDGEISADTDNRNRKQCIGRMKKYIGDLCLLTGVPEEAIFHYSVAIDFLRSIGDLLWMSGSLEGLCAASLLCRTEHKIVSPERPSLQLDISQLSTAGSDGDENRIVIPLTDMEIVEKAEEIFQIYEKQKESRVLSIEARFKYARFFLSKKRHRDVSIALQDVLATELTFKLSDAEKIQLYSAMAMIYEDVGYMRKAAFFTRVAARHCTSQHLPPQGWTASYNLMRNALDGYKIHFDDENAHGWPELKIQLMKELIEMSKELQNNNIPIRHILYLLQTMHSDINENDMQELISLLEKLASTSQGHFNLVDDLHLDNNDVLPALSLTELPIVRSMKVNVLASHLRPVLSPSSSSPVKTPFIFSTLNKGPRKNKKTNPAIRWVEGDFGEVAMQVFNPMPFDIKISKMTLLTEGVPFQAFPSCLALSTDNMSHPFMLLGIPEGSGQLAITGYSVELFGIQSNCSITQTILDKQFSLPLIVDVTPRLPLIQFQSDINDVKSFVNSSHRGSSLTLEVKMYKGQTISGPILVENVGKIPVEDLAITILSSFKTDTLNLVTLDKDHVTESLPLLPEQSSHFNLKFCALMPDSLQSGGKLNWSGKLRINYSGGEAWKLGISRNAVVDIRIEVVPSVQLLNYSFVSVEKSDDEHFEICMDIHNQTNHDIDWRFQMNSGIAYPEEVNRLKIDQSLRATLELEKFDLSDDDKKTQHELCLERILNLVKLSWQIPELKVFGVLNLDGLKITEDIMKVVKRNGFIFEMSVNDEKIKKGSCVSCVASKPIFLTVSVCNSSDKDAASFILNIEPFEVDDNGVQNFDVKQRICWLGATSTLQPKIPAKSKLEHSFALIFLSPGQFFMNIKCFERVHTDNDQPFRGRAHVIKDVSSNRRSRSSRTDSFTESLLLRQRSQSTPLAQCAYFISFEVGEDPDTIINNDCSSDDPQVKKNCASLAGADNISSDQCNEEFSEQKNTASEVSDAVEFYTEVEILPTVANVALNDIIIPSEENSNRGELSSSVMSSQEQLISDDEIGGSKMVDKLEVKMDDVDEDEGHKSVLERNKHCSINDRQKTSKNDGEDISEQSKDRTSVPGVSDTVIPFDDVSQNKEFYSNKPDDSCHTENQEIDLNSAETQNDLEKQHNVTPQLNKVTMAEKGKSNEISNEEMSKPDNMQEGDDQRTDVSNNFKFHQRSDETELRSPSVKEKIMFFNSG